MTRTLALTLYILGIAAAVFLTTSAAQAGAPTFSPVPIPRPTAQTACGTHDSIVGRLAEKYGEARVGAGLSGPTAIYEIWASKDTGTWTILRTTPNGLACVMAVGDGWRDDSLKGLTGDWL